MVLTPSLNIMETWRLALLYCAKHLLHFDEARQRRAREGVERNKEGVSERERAPVARADVF